MQVPRFRDDEFSTEMFSRYQRSEQALVFALMEIVVNGVFIRKVSQFTEELCGSKFSKSTVSDLCKKLDPTINAWNNRVLQDTFYPFILVDALGIDGRVLSGSALIVIGVNAEGYREVLGLRLGDSESEASWSEFFTWLKSRNLRGVDLIVSDDQGGRSAN